MTFTASEGKSSLDFPSTISRAICSAFLIPTGMPPQFGEYAGHHVGQLGALFDQKLAGRADTVNLKNVLGQIQADRANLHCGWLPRSGRMTANPSWHSDAVSGNHPPHPFFQHLKFAEFYTPSTKPSPDNPRQFGLEGPRARPRFPPGRKWHVRVPRCSTNARPPESHAWRARRGGTKHFETSGKPQALRTRRLRSSRDLLQSVSHFRMLKTGDGD